jgi:streptogramin lyase
VNVVARSNIGIGAQPGTTNLYVLGNMAVTNALTASNIFTTNVNVSGTINTLTLIATSNIGIGTTPVGANLYIQGNVFVANAFTATNIVASGNIYYGEDLTKRYPHLLPTTANANSIQNWISSTCNAVSQPTEGWWCANKGQFTISTGVSLPFDNSHAGGVMLPDGRVVFVPNSTSVIRIFNPYTNELTSISGTGTEGGFNGGVLLPSGNVVFVPGSGSNIGIFNPISSQYTNVGPVGTSWAGGVLAPNGNVFFIPYNAANVGVYNPNISIATPSPTPAGCFSNIMSGVGTLGSAYYGGTLLPSGNIICTPHNSPNIGVIDPVTLTFSNCGPIGAFTDKHGGSVLAPNGNVIFSPWNDNAIGVYNPNTPVSSPIQAGAYSRIVIPGLGDNYCKGGGTLLPTGNIVFFPYDESNIIMADPIALTYSNIVYIGTAGSGHFFAGSRLLMDGRVIGVPYDKDELTILNTFMPAPPREFCLSPFFNKL